MTAQLSERTAGVALTAVSAASFGAMAIFARLAYEDGTDVTALLFLRFLIASACMVAVLRLRRLAWPRGRALAGLAAMGGVGYVGQSLCYFTALTLASASLVALLLYAYPALVTVFSAVLLGVRLTARKVAALVVALVGTVLIIGPEAGGDPLGVVLGLSAAAIYSGYILAGSRLAPGVGPFPSAAVVMVAAAAVYAVVSLVQRPTFPSTTGSWLAVAGIALVSTVVAITTFFAGMERVGPADASTLSTLEPVVTVVLAAVVLDERLGPVQVGGGVLVLAAVLLLARVPSDT